VSADLFDAVSRIARHEVDLRSSAAVGVVTEVHAGPDHSCTLEVPTLGLVLPRVPIAVGVPGFAATPHVDDLVLVSFVDGDLHFPVVVGSLYNAAFPPPAHTEHQVVLRLPAGGPDPSLNLVVDGSAPSVHLALPNDTTVDVQGGTVRIAVGAVHVELSGGGNGRVDVAAGGTRLSLAEDGDVTVESELSLTLKAKSNITIEAAGKVAISGATVELN
jgi:uncharacterized protein involved in type VI secretion and phage assembly